ncbi:MAG: glutamine synthetase, partial [Armatimonadetes bacterium]|nr:glutamine synthetase [Armatimonadota bacterium]
LEQGKGFDGSSIEGFARIDESDMVMMPDPGTFCILPWRPKEGGGVARMFCDIVEPDGTPHAGDPRWVLRRNLQRAADMGFTFYVAPELEFFYFKDANLPPQALDEGGYFDLTPLDVASDLRRETVLALEAMGVGVESSHHEVAPSQHEIELRYTDALTMADSAMTYRLVVKEVAMKYGYHATFMPKPIYGQCGSGMHTNLSLFRGDTNAFYSSRDSHHLSKIAKQFIAGLLHHAQEITLITNQWVNSYKRLVPGFEAPVYVSWAFKNRSDLIRVPTYKKGREHAMRVEYRSPDPACNPYLAFAVMVAAGLAGIEHEYELPPAMGENLYAMSDEERKKRGIRELPEDLWEAIKMAEQSQLVRTCLGDHLFTKFIQNKKFEWETYRAQVTDYELKRYLSVL